jgi:hypothetical protein
MKWGRVLLLFLLTIFFVSGLWMVDVAVIGISSGGSMLNVYGSVYEPVSVFHAGIFLQFICFLSLGVIFIFGDRNYAKN